MDRAEISDLAHAQHPIAAPLSDETVDRLIALAMTGRRCVLDLGCGDGSWLLRALRREPALTAVGVDLSGLGFDRVLEQADQEGRRERLQLVRADAREWTSADQFDVVVCVGATHAFGGLLPTLTAAAQRLHPGGQVLVGDGFREPAPSDHVLTVLEAAVEDYRDLGATVDAVASAGWVPVQGTSAAGRSGTPTSGRGRDPWRRGPWSTPTTRTASR